MTAATSEDFIQALGNALEEFGVEHLTSEQMVMLDRHYQVMIEWNRLLNLTRITAIDEAARFHYAESLLGGRFIDSAQTALDIGSGAGFPGVPLAILKPGLSVTALEANSKKAAFLSEVKDALALENFRVVNARIENIDLSGYHLLMSRALDRAADVIPNVASKLTAGQRLMIYCGSDLVEGVKRLLGADSLRELLSIPGSKSRLIAVFGAKRANE